MSNKSVRIHGRTAVSVLGFENPTLEAELPAVGGTSDIRLVEDGNGNASLCVYTTIDGITAWFPLVRGSEAATKYHTQLTPSQQWRIVHDFGVPADQIWWIMSETDGSGNRTGWVVTPGSYEGDPADPLNVMLVNFPEAIRGTAYLVTTRAFGVARLNASEIIIADGAVELTADGIKLNGVTLNVANLMTVAQFEQQWTDTYLPQVSQLVTDGDAALQENINAEATARAEAVSALLPKTDVVDDLLTADQAKALSANQGVVLKALIDALGSGGSVDYASVIAALGYTPVNKSGDVTGPLLADYVGVKGAIRSSLKLLAHYNGYYDDEVGNPAIFAGAGLSISQDNSFTGFLKPGAVKYVGGADVLSYPAGLVFGTSDFLIRWKMAIGSPMRGGVVDPILHMLAGVVSGATGQNVFGVFQAPSKLYLQVNSAGAAGAYSPTLPTDGTPFEIAIRRINGVVQWVYNGVADGAGVSIPDFNDNGTTDFYVFGSNQSSSAGGTGPIWIGELEISIGDAVYSGNYTPITVPQQLHNYSSLNLNGYAKLDAVQTFSKGQSQAVTTIPATGTITMDFAANNVFEVSPTGNFTLANPLNVQPGVITPFVLLVNQPVGGNAAITSFGTAFKSPGGNSMPVLSTPANSKDIVFGLAKSSSEVVVLGIKKAYA